MKWGNPWNSRFWVFVPFSCPFPSSSPSILLLVPSALLLINAWNVSEMFLRLYHHRNCFLGEKKTEKKKKNSTKKRWKINSILVFWSATGRRGSLNVRLFSATVGRIGSLTAVRGRRSIGRRNGDRRRLLGDAGGGAVAAEDGAQLRHTPADLRTSLLTSSSVGRSHLFVGIVRVARRVGRSVGSVGRRRRLLIERRKRLRPVESTAVRSLTVATSFRLDVLLVATDHQRQLLGRRRRVEVVADVDVADVVDVGWGVRGVAGRRQRRLRGERRLRFDLAELGPVTRCLDVLIPRSCSCRRALSWHRNRLQCNDNQSISCLWCWSFFFYKT